MLFDWSGTLAHDPTPVARLSRALELVERDADDQCQRLSARLDHAATHPDVVTAMADEDTSAARHRAANMLWFDYAGLDAALAEALYAFDDDAGNRPLYPDVIPTLASLQALGVKVGVVSDIHIDIRLLLAQQGAARFVDAYVLSFEHNCQKPDPRMFMTALQILDVAADRTLMVGDRSSHDRGLDVVTRMVVGPGPTREYR